jgi:Integrase core domain
LAAGALDLVATLRQLLVFWWLASPIGNWFFAAISGVSAHILIGHESFYEQLEGLTPDAPLEGPRPTTRGTSGRGKIQQRSLCKKNMHDETSVFYPAFIEQWRKHYNTVRPHSSLAIDRRRHRR